MLIRFGPVLQLPTLAHRTPNLNASDPKADKNTSKPASILSPLGNTLLTTRVLSPSLSAPPLSLQPRHPDFAWSNSILPQVATSARRPPRSSSISLVDGLFGPATTPLEDVLKFHPARLFTALLYHRLGSARLVVTFTSVLASRGATFWL